jgi:hypothetical protein
MLNRNCQEFDEKGGILLSRANNAQSEPVFRYLTVSAMFKIRRENGMLPSLTADEKRKALEKAQAMRKARAVLREQLKKGEVKLEEVLNRDDPVVARMKVSYLLSSLPRVGKVKAERIMQEVGINESRRVQGLGSRQKQALLARFMDK